MNIFIFALITSVLIFFSNYFLKKIKLFHNYSGQNHQKFLGSKKIPLTGGIYLLILSLLIFYKFSFLICLFLVLIFFIGLVSDINYLSSPSIRFFLQIFSLFTFIYVFKIEVTPTRIYYLDLILNNIVLSFIFTTFCLMIVINGTNFIDGLNGLVLLYYLAIYIIISHFGFYFEFGIDEKKINYFMILLIILSLFNFNNQLFLGDSGSYLLSFITSIILINIYYFNPNLSPFFIILLLWYPCFENLFSIIRKFKIKRSPILADNKHLHQLLFDYLRKRINWKKNYINNFTSFLILSYNFFVFFLATKDISDTQYQISLILMNIFVYIFIYIRLFNYFFKINSK